MTKFPGWLRYWGHPVYVTLRSASLRHVTPANVIMFTYRYFNITSHYTDVNILHTHYFPHQMRRHHFE